MELGKRRKSREHLATSSKGNVFTRNKGVRHDDGNKTVDAERGRATSTGIQQMNAELDKEFTFDREQFKKDLQELYEDHLKNHKPTMKDLTPDPEKYGREFEELHSAERREYSKYFKELNDEELFAAYDGSQDRWLKREISFAQKEACDAAITVRLMEPRFQSPVPMPSIHAVAQAAGFGGAFDAGVVYLGLSKYYSDEDIGLTDYNPPFLDGETQDSIAWKIRKDLGNEANRRHALMKALYDQRKELMKGSYEFTPNPEPEPKVTAAPAGPRPPGDSNPPSDWKYPDNFAPPESNLADYYNQKIPNKPKE